MIPGITAAQMLGTGGGATGAFLIDFVNGIYTVGATSYTLADAITHTGLVSGSGLAVPANDAGTIIEILGPFQSRLIAGAWTAILEVSGMSAVVDVAGFSTFLTVQGADVGVNAIQIFRNTSDAIIKADDYDGAVNNLVNSGLAVGTGTHKIGVTRNDFAFPIALAVDGTLYDWFTDSDLPAAPWTQACFGGDFQNGTQSGFNLRSLGLTDAVALADLAALTA